MNEPIVVVNAKRLCRGPHCHIHDSFEVVEKRINHVKYDDNEYQPIIEKVSLFIVDDEIRITEIGAGNVSHMHKIVSPIDLNHFITIFSIVIVAIVILCLRVAFQKLQSKKRKYTKDDGLYMINQIKKYERNYPIEDVDELQIVTIALESRLLDESLPHIEHIYNVIKGSIRQYYTEALHEEDIPINYEQLSLCDAISKTIFSAEHISDKLIEYHSFNKIAVGRRDEICVRALSQTTSVSRHPSMVTYRHMMICCYDGQVDKRFDDLHMAVILCDGIGRISPMEAEVYKSALDNLYVNEIRHRARGLLPIQDENDELLSGEDEILLLEQATRHFLSPSMPSSPLRAITNSVDGDMVAIQNNASNAITTINFNPNSHTHAVYAEDHHEVATILSSIAVRRQSLVYDDICLRIRQERSSRDQDARSRIDREFTRSIEADTTKYHDDHHRTRNDWKEHKRVAEARKVRVNQAYHIEKRWWQAVDAGMFTVTAALIIIVYACVKYHDLLSYRHNQASLSLNHLFVLFFRPFCDHMCRSSTDIEISPPPLKVINMSDMLQAYIISPISIIAPVIKSSFTMTLSSLNIDEDDAYCIWKLLLVILPILIISWISSIICYIMPSYLISYGAKVIELAMMVDYIIVPVLIPLGSNWPIIMLLLINYAVQLSISQFDERIRWSETQSKSYRRVYIMYAGYPMLMTFISYLIATNVVYDAYYYARLYHVI